MNERWRDVLKRLLKIKNLKQSFFLFGPRGSGKTSWIQQHFSDALYIDLLKTRDYMLLQADPSRLETMVMAHDSPWTVIDEVQKIPALLDEVHRLIENHQRCFVLSGSSARKLKRGGANLLAGRAILYHMHPLTAIEIGQSFDVKKALQFGLLPHSYLQNNAKDFLESYMVTYLKEEVLQESLVRNISGFSRFIEIASFSQGNQLNLTAIAQECSISQKIVREYFEILEDLLIAVQIPCFTKRAQRKLVQHPKFYYFDAGVYQYIRPRGPLDLPEEIGGAAFETLFLQNLRAIIDYERLDLKIYFWRTATQVEVDFIVYGENGLFAFELKSTRHIRNKDLSSLKIFKTDYPIARCYLIYTGDHAEQRGDIRILPIRDALLQLSTLLKKAARV